MLLALKQVNDVFMVGIFYRTAFFRKYTPGIGYHKKSSTPLGSLYMNNRMYQQR